jgi:small subunit ribosomal protein S25
MSIFHFFKKNCFIYLFLQTNVEIVDRLVKTLGKRKEVLEDEALAAEKKDNPANFGPGCERFCPCELPGQLPCPAIIPVPKKWRGKYHYHKYQDEDQEE